MIPSLSNSPSDCDSLRWNLLRLFASSELLCVIITIIINIDAILLSPSAFPVLFRLPLMAQIFLKDIDVRLFASPLSSPVRSGP